jgi:hypothetical protein
MLAGISLSANPVIQGMAADTWQSLPNTKIRPLCPASTACTGINGIEGCGAVVWSWSGGTFDTRRNRIIIWGGGHGAYFGNEVYGFDVNALTWSRITEPSCPVASNTTCQGTLSDGTPNGRHTYDGLDYIAHADAFFCFGGSLSCGTPCHSNLTWTLDFATNKWKDMQPAGTPPGQGQLVCLTSAYDSLTRKVYLRDPYNLYSYDYTANQWTTLGSWTGPWADQTSTIDTKRRLLFAGGSGSLIVRDLVANRDVTANWQTTGGASIIAAAAPGLKYDPVSDNLVALVNFTVYELDMATKAWTQKATANITPPSQYHGGHYGRFSYSPAENAFFFVPAVDDNVWVYKHTAGGGSSAETGSKTPDRLPDISASPNPASGKVFIRASNCRSLRIYNINGECVDNISRSVAGLSRGTPFEISWKPAGLPAGIYILKAADSRGSVSKRIFLQ